MIFRLTAAVSLAALAAMGQTPGACQSLRRHGKLQEADRCFTALTHSPDPYFRAEGFWGLDDTQSANGQFRIAVKEHPENADYRVRWGRLFYEHWQPADAAQLFNEALGIRKDYAPAFLGLALVAADGFEAKAVQLAEQALKSDPKLVEAQELLARLALEDNNPKKAIAEADKAIALSPEALDAMAIRAAIDWLNDAPSTPWIDRILKINPVYGEAYATAGHFFVLNRRYEEGIRFFRKALELDPKLWDVRSELGVNLMRLGDEDEARRQLEECFNSGYKSNETVNSLRLLDSYKNFVTHKTPTTILRLNKKEDALLRPYFQSELEAAVATYQKKYKYKLSRPVQLEVYPNHEDFAVRTMGMPGLGALGVTFGYVVAMDSPSARKPGSFHWASTMWHELSHVYVLSMTGHRVPRWFTEGLAVYEESAVAPDWGDRLDPESIHAMHAKLLLPVAELDRGFIRPSYPSQVIVSYFQAGQICQYIASRWGYDRLLAMIHDFGERKTTPEVIDEELKMKPDEFDRQFLAWLDARYKKTVDGFAEWSKRLKNVAELSAEKKYDDVIREGNAIRDLYPDYVEAGSVYEFLAEAYLAKDDKEDAVKQLERYSQEGGRNPSTIEKLARLEQEQGRKQDAAATLNRLNFIYPEDDKLHSWLGDLYLSLGNVNGAIREFEAAVAEQPIDVAGAQYRLARAYQAARRLDDAREHVLLALEAAPGFKPAQKLLLELSAKE